LYKVHVSTITHEKNISIKSLTEKRIKNLRAKGHPLLADKKSAKTVNSLPYLLYTMRNYLNPNPKNRENADTLRYLFLWKHLEFWE